MAKNIQAEFNGKQINFNAYAWFNATEVAKAHGKDVHEWVRLPSTTGYINALEVRYGKIPYVKTSKARSDRGGGTWLHPKLAIVFARWISDDFAIWCDEQIEKIIHGDKNSIDWMRERHASKQSNKVLNAVLQETMRLKGVEAQRADYAKESAMINMALSGGLLTSIDRDKLPLTTLDLLAKMEARNTVMIGYGVGFDERARVMRSMVKEQKKLGAK